MPAPHVPLDLGTDPVRVGAVLDVVLAWPARAALIVLIRAALVVAGQIAEDERDTSTMTVADLLAGHLEERH